MLGKYYDEESGPIGEPIWPSNLVFEKDGVLKIDGNEFDKSITEIEKLSKEDNNEERLKEIEKIRQKKDQVLFLIKKKLEQWGYQVEMI